MMKRHTFLSSSRGTVHFEVSDHGLATGCRSKEATFFFKGFYFLGNIKKSYWAAHLNP